LTTSDAAIAFVVRSVRRPAVLALKRGVAQPYLRIGRSERERLVVGGARLCDRPGAREHVGDRHRQIRRLRRELARAAERRERRLLIPARAFDAAQVLEGLAEI